MLKSAQEYLLWCKRIKSLLLLSGDWYSLNNLPFNAEQAKLVIELNVSNDIAHTMLDYETVTGTGPSQKKNMAESLSPRRLNTGLKGRHSMRLYNLMAGHQNADLMSRQVATMWLVNSLKASSKTDLQAD
ncbi:hypothetical protein MIR68_003761 [Amoeboaphelidium protococcarum]|nr:hypothetical protein MIR68_003761 [Amoeboaphelidium protococcarum]